MNTFPVWFVKKDSITNMIGSIILRLVNSKISLFDELSNHKICFAVNQTYSYIISFSTNKLTDIQAVLLKY